MQPYKIAIILMTAIFCMSLPSLAEEREKKTFYIDGWHIKADILAPTVKRNVKLPMVVMFNKASGDRKDYHAFARKLLDKGFASMRVDLRGHGESINRGSFNPKNKSSFKILKNSFKDIAVITEWVRGNPSYNGVALIGASYSGEHLMLAADTGIYADAYIALSPGSFSDESIGKIDATKKPWFFLRSQTELSFFDEIFSKLNENSKTAKIQIVDGDKHASDMLIDNPELEDELITWLTLKLK